MLGLPEGTLLVDTPPDLRTQLLREKIGLVHATLFTHDHADHVFGLDDLRLFPYYLGHPMPIYCEEQVEARIRKSFDYCFADDAQGYPAGAVPQLRFERIGLEPFSVLGQRVVPIRLQHGRFQRAGFPLRQRGLLHRHQRHSRRRACRCLDGLDVLILDALRPRPHATHFSLEEAIAMAQRIGARRTLFTHMSHELEHEATNAALPRGMELAYDGLRIPLT